MEEVWAVCPFWSQMCCMTLASRVGPPQAQTLVLGVVLMTAEETLHTVRYGAKQ